MPAESPHSQRFYRSLVSSIRRSRRAVTIMFTDVEGSTHYWDSHGDVKGRLMVDLHNRLLCPVIERLGGKVVKHVGDSIMASFRSPRNALKAAIGIQQVLEQHRTEDKSLIPKVRIGVHTGKALVERDDVLGDMVNVASRVRDYTKGCEICVSGSTASKVKRKSFELVKRGEFLPKGKRKAITIYECEWRKYPSLADALASGRGLPLVRRQKIELAGYFLAAVAVAYLLGHRYVRYLALDQEGLALVARKLSSVGVSVPVVLTLAAALGLGLLAAWKSSSSHIPYRVIKGGFGFAAAFLVFFLPATLLPLRIESKWNQPLHRAEHNFVRVEEDGVEVREAPSITSPLAGTAGDGELLVLQDVTDKGRRTWFKVLLGVGRSGWIRERVPPTVGAPGRRLAAITSFSFRYKDLYALIAGLLGFAWGLLTFRIRLA